MSTIITKEENENSVFNLSINHFPAILLCNNLYACVMLQDKNLDVVLTYSMYTFYEKYLGGKKLTHLHSDIVQYYNTTEEQSFQYNTTQDYSTHQAMVHIHDSIRKVDSCTRDSVLEALQDLIHNPRGVYTITIENLPETGGSS